jgi:hypothetical protein
MANPLNVGRLLPKLDLGAILKDVGEAVSTLKSVAGPESSWSQFSSAFESKLLKSPLFQQNWGLLPNPIHQLAEKLLQGTGSLLEAFGKNLASLGAGLEGNVPRDVPGVDQPVTLPSLDSPERLDAMVAGTSEEDGSGFEELDPLLQSKRRELRSQLEQIEQLISTLRARQEAKMSLRQNTPRWSA